VRPAGAAIGVLLRAAPRLRAPVQKLLWRAVYEIASLRADALTIRLMNYGYAELEPTPDAEEAPAPAASAAADGQVTDGFGLALYGAVAAGAELTGRDVLEVGCGRGGGSAFLFERFAPRSMTGVDLAHIAIERCRRQYGRPGLTFLAADAQQLPFPDESFDTIVNVESSHCYPDMAAFLAEVRRVLRPGGVLLLADFRLTSSPPGQANPDDVPALRRRLTEAGMRTIAEQDITAEVVRARSLATPSVRAYIQRRMPRLLQRRALEFAAIEGTPIYRSFAERRLTYLRFVLEKQ
jgi:ubiquinone/menaquinone biosynthesis C-methylase UbiE